jgi:hypothetical protein
MEASVGRVVRLARSNSRLRPLVWRVVGAAEGATHAGIQSNLWDRRREDDDQDFKASGSTVNPSCSGRGIRVTTPARPIWAGCGKNLVFRFP